MGPPLSKPASISIVFSMPASQLIMSPDMFLTFIERIPTATRHGDMPAFATLIEGMPRAIAGQSATFYPQVITA